MRQLLSHIMTIRCQPEVVCDKTCNKDAQWPTQDKRNKRAQCCNQIHVVVLGLLTLLLVFCAIGMIVILIKQKQPSVNKFKEDATDDIVAEETTPLDIEKGIRIIPRLEWSARPSVSDVYLKLPVPYVVICHTAMKKCTDQTSCIAEVQAIQSFHMETRDWDDIAYNFLIGGDGRVYEGTGWKFEGAHTLGYNANGMGIAFMGNYNYYSPTKQQINAASQLIKIGVELKYLAGDYKLVAARQLQPTQSPGLMLYENMKSWPHWTKNP